MHLWKGIAGQTTSVPQPDDQDKEGSLFGQNLRLDTDGEIIRRKGLMPCTTTGAFQCTQYSLPVVGVGAILATSTGSLVTVPL